MQFKGFLKNPTFSPKRTPSPANDKTVDASANDNADEKDMKEDDYVYKLPTFIPLELDDDGQAKRLRIPDQIKTSPVKDLDLSKVSTHHRISKSVSRERLGGGD